MGIYACGPTVYARVHVGNARPFVVFSQLKRFLEHEGYGVTLVGNVTDINDKIYDAARAAGRPSAELAAEMARALPSPTRTGSGSGRPDAEPYATEYVGQIVELIQRLIDGGTRVCGRPATSTSACGRSTSYGELSRRDLDQMDQGEGVEGADLKEDPLDFALWKAWKEGEDTSWDAPWGRGRPGWHIECSAMAEALLGVEFDIHGGGIDLVFPHHENEAAQTLAARGAPLARIWMHNGMLELGGARRCPSRSGNIRGLGEVLDEVGGRGARAVLQRRPLPAAAGVLRRARSRTRGARRRGSATRGGGWSRARRRTRWRRTATRSSTRCATTSTRPRRWPRCTAGSARRTAPRSRSATRTCARCSTCSGSWACWRAEEGPPAEAVELAERRDAGAPRHATGPRPTGCATSCARMGWEVRDGPDGPELVPAS